MRTFNKTVVWLIAAVSIVLFYFGFFGAKTYYGDVATVVVNGAEQLVLGNGLDQTVSVKLSPSSSEAVPSGDQLELSRRIIEERLAAFGLPDYNVYINYDDPSLVVEMPYGADLNSVAILAGATGEFYVRRGTEETDSSIIFGLSNVESADVQSTASSLFTVSSLHLELDSAAKTALKTATQEMADEYAASETTQKISVWYDGQLITTKEITEPITNGQLDFDMIFNLDTSTANELNVILNSDEMPYAFTGSSITEVDTSLVSAPRALIVACAAAAVVIALYFLIRYRLSGLTAVLSLVGMSGSLMAYLTGFFMPNAHNFTFATLAAFALSVLLAAYALLQECAAIRKECNANALQRSISDTMKKQLGLTMRAFCSLLIPAIVLSLFSNGLLLYNLLQPAFNAMGVNSSLLASVGSFGETLTWGIIFAMVFCVLGNRLMLWSVFSYSGAKKPGLVGGAANE